MWRGSSKSPHRARIFYRYRGEERVIPTIVEPPTTPKIPRAVRQLERGRCIGLCSLLQNQTKGQMISCTFDHDMENREVFSLCKEAIDEDSRDSGFAELSRPGSVADMLESLKVTSDTPEERCGETHTLCKTPIASNTGKNRVMRKRGLAQKDMNQEPKRHKQNFVPSNSGFPAPTRVLARAFSTSVLERGEYAHSLNESFDLPETNYHLPTVDTSDSLAFRRIAPKTLAELLSSNDFLDSYVLIDCRYAYEFNGGHINNAINIFDPTNVNCFLDGKFGGRIPIFYCEFSQKRGPGMANALRRLDRIRNEQQYPFVDYEEIYVLDGGYNRFFESFGTMGFCEPHGYVSMDDERFVDELRKYSFHKKGTISTTVKPVGRSLLRQRSLQNISPSSHSTMSSPSTMTTPSRGARRLLFDALDELSEGETTPARMDYV